MIKTETMNDTSSTPDHTLNDATCTITTNSTPQSTKDFEEEHINREYLSATLNFPYKEFISNNDKNHIKIWNDEEEQSRLEKHFNPKWQVDSCPCSTDQKARSVTNLLLLQPIVLTNRLVQ
jgi:hypothetical protein